MRWARTLFVVALGVLPLMAMGFAARLGLRFADALLVAGLLVSLPLLSLAQLPLLPLVRLRPVDVYRSSAVTMAGLAALVAAAAWSGPGIAVLGLSSPDWGADLVRGTGLFVGGMSLTLLSLLVERRLPLEGADFTRLLLPRTASDRWAFVAATVVAAIGEEAVYRAYLITQVAPHFGDPWGGLLLSSAAFGVLHAYQGPVGIVRTAVVGAWLGLGWIVFDSLWPSVIAHLLMNLSAGLVLPPWLERREPRDAIGD